MSKSFVLDSADQQTLLVALREVWKHQPESRQRVENLVQSLKWSAQDHQCFNNAQEPVCLLCGSEYAGNMYLAEYQVQKEVK